DGITLAMLQPVDAELRFLRRHGGIGVAGDRDVRREIDPSDGKGFGELEAGAGRGRIRIDGEIQDAEAVLLAKPLVDGADIRVVPQREARGIGVERWTPDALVRIDLSQKGKRRSLFGR